MKKLGLYTETVYYKSQDSYYSSDIFILFFRKIFPLEKINITGRLNKKDIHIGYELDNSYTTFFGLSNYKNIPVLLTYLPLYLLLNLKRFKNFVSLTDHLYVATPSPISLVLVYLFILRKKEVTIFVRQDIRELTKNRYKNFISYQISNISEKVIENVVKKNPSIKVFTFGKRIEKRYKKYTKNVYSIADTRFSIKDIINKKEIYRIRWDNNVKLLFLGRLEKGKGIEIIFEAISKLEMLNFSLTIIGNGSLMASLKNKCNLLGIEKKVIFAGYIPFGENLLNNIRKHDILILPSLSEGLPQVILEAMACGLLVIGTNVGGIPDIINNNFNGFLIEKDNSIQLETLLLKLENDKFDNTLFCSRALETAKEYCNENQVLKIKNILAKP